MRKRIIYKIRKEGDFCSGETVAVQKKEITTNCR